MGQRWQSICFEILLQFQFGIHGFGQHEDIHWHPVVRVVGSDDARVKRPHRCPGGIVAACQWNFRDGMPSLSLFWDSVREAHPDPQVQQEAKKRNPPGYSDAESLARLWSTAGLRSVETLELEISMSFASFDDYWRPFLSGATRTSSYAMTLPDPVREKVVQVLRKRLIGTGPDRPFDLPARAWAVRGIVP